MLNKNELMKKMNASIEAARAGEVGKVLLNS